MSSDPETTELSPSIQGEDVVASVRLRAEDEKLIRRAAVEVDQNRSEFMAEAAVRRAREVLDAVPTQRASA